MPSFATAETTGVSITLGRTDILTASRTFLPARSIAAALSKVKPKFALSAEINALTTLGTFPPASMWASNFPISTATPALAAAIIALTIMLGGTLLSLIPIKS